MTKLGHVQTMNWYDLDTSPNSSFDSATSELFSLQISLLLITANPGMVRISLMRRFDIALIIF
jgi:hypothetical protein